MFRILQQTFRTGIVTTSYPDAPAQIPGAFRGRPAFDFEHWRDARPAADVCPTHAISIRQEGNSRTVMVDYGCCIFCGLCAEAGPDSAIRLTQEFELAARDRSALVTTAEYELNPDGTHRQLLTASLGGEAERPGPHEIHELLGRSLSIRQVDAGSCNGCELEIVAL